ncbi:peptide-methionine (S)-S-oxide reductase [Deinococcus psychrotolerans]|uniref:Peptide methionine sulfoxide reductase MsrA n=1 Tax=Deinococcus psychrotolerans TaxID=2489213 RepID=A0A3G8YB25_9DEIO|nr:peptide-methionine (S)-S-oxide reductase MsrA [Deinococcus psychrotolerans]AZI42508.1 peptide-methionine (S)-S-oxide reductase [Deinococcus psychrotolerans]
MTDSTLNPDSSASLQTAILASGCFWCTEAVFDNVKGIAKVESGYIGGSVANPSYNQVCSGRTGHAEAVRLTFDPSVIPYRDVLGIFFATHDPTQLNRQGHDVGTQYRSAVFYQTDAEKAEVQAFIDDLSAQHVYDQPIVTTLEPVSQFYVAEDYHQSYFANNPTQPYCMAVITPKVIKMRKSYSHYLNV